MGMRKDGEMEKRGKAGLAGRFAGAMRIRRRTGEGRRRRLLPKPARRLGRAGQMTVEFAVVAPVLLAVAVIAVNALLFFSDCAAFDRVARQAVRICATSPAYGQGLEQSRAQVASLIEGSLDQPYLDSRVAVEGAAGGHATFSATLEFSPTLFGLGLKSSVFGVALPHLEHTVALTVDAYKPGVVL